MKSAIKQSTAKMIGAYFQKLLVPVFVFASFVPVQAQLHSTSPSTVSYKEISRIFENVEISGDVIVVLTDDEINNVMLKGNSRDIEMVTAEQTDNKLQINAERKKTVSKLVVYLPVATLHSLKVTGNAKIFSSGDIVVDDLAITVKGDSMVRVYYHGKLTIAPAEGYEMADVASAY